MVERGTHAFDHILTFFVQNLGPAIYNQAIQDARKYMPDRLDDLDATFLHVCEYLHAFVSSAATNPVHDYGDDYGL